MGKDSTHTLAQVGNRHFLDNLLKRTDEVGKVLDLVYSCPDLEKLHSHAQWAVAGSVFLDDEPNDIDFYRNPVLSKEELSALSRYVVEAKQEIIVVSCTDNALTLRGTSPLMVQFCTFPFRNLGELLDSFDFAHCQIGANMYTCKDCKSFEFTNSVQWTKAFEQFRIFGTSFYTGSKTPFQTLLRMKKYLDRGLFSTLGWSYSLPLILEDIVKQGLEDPTIFKKDGLSEQLLQSLRLKELFRELQKSYTLSRLQNARV